MKNQGRKDISFLNQALVLAKKAEGLTSPNPLVGAVVAKNNRIISQGFHKAFGRPHAEIEAMLKLNKAQLKGAILYLNLEPCSHFGKTPPCVDQIIKNKFKRVVISTLDPNPKVRGKSVRKLRKAKITVAKGLLVKEALRLNEVFFKNMAKTLPFVVGKIAQSLDGKISSSRGESKWITSLVSRNRAKSLRDKYDSVLVGVNTVIKDDPTLKGLKKTPFRIVIDPNLRIPLKAKLLKKNREKLIIFTSFKSKRLNKNIPSGVKVFFLKEKNKRLPLKNILKQLWGTSLTKS